MKRWTKAGIGLTAVLLAIAAATGAYAMRDGDGPSGDKVTDSAGDGAMDGGIAAVCAPGFKDCDDMIVVPEEGCGEDVCPGADEGITCEEADACDRRYAACPQDGICTDIPVPCDDVVDCQVYETCVLLQTDPPIEKCTVSGCAYVAPPGPLTDPAPEYIGPPETIIEPAPEATIEAVPYCEPTVPCEGDGCLPVDCGITVPEPAPDADPAETMPLPPVCEPPVPCEGDGCLPPDCAVSSDGTLLCPTPCPDNARCIPPECTFGDDGSVSCPGSPGTQTLPADCTDEASVVHCVDPAPGSGSGSGGADGAEATP